MNRLDMPNTFLSRVVGLTLCCHSYLTDECDSYFNVDCGLTIRTTTGKLTPFEIHVIPNGYSGHG
jgi:hypothetical protein